MQSSGRDDNLSTVLTQATPRWIRRWLQSPAAIVGIMLALMVAGFALSPASA